MATTIQDIYISGLVNAHAVENQAVELLGRQVERLETYQAMRERMRQHIDESRRQAARLEQILQSLGSSPSTLKDVGLSIMGNLAALAHAPAQDEVMKNTLANFAFEHYEIASYRALLVMAGECGDTRGPAMLRESLDEEIAMATWIEDHLDETTRAYMRLTATGQKAGV